MLGERGGGSSCVTGVTVTVAVAAQTLVFERCSLFDVVIIFVFFFDMKGLGSDTGRVGTRRRSRSIILNLSISSCMVVGARQRMDMNITVAIAVACIVACIVAGVSQFLSY